MTESRARELCDALQKQFGGQTEFEAVNGSGRYRFVVASNQFDNIPHLTRQDRIWEFLDGVVSPQDSLDISLVLAYSTAELTATT